MNSRLEQCKAYTTSSTSPGEKHIPFTIEPGISQGLRMASESQLDDVGCMKARLRKVQATVEVGSVPG